MNELVIVVVEDESDVRAAIVRDLAPLAEGIRIDEADTVDDTEAAIAVAVSTPTPGMVANRWLISLNRCHARNLRSSARISCVRLAS